MVSVHHGSKFLIISTTVVIDHSSVGSTDSILSNGDGKNEVIDYISIADRINDTGKILTFLKTYIPKKKRKFVAVENLRLLRRFQYQH